MASVIDFLKGLYRKRAQSSDPAYSLAWSAASRFRSDDRLFEYRNYLISHFSLDEEDLDTMFAAEALRAAIGVNDNAPAPELSAMPFNELMNLAKRNGIKEEYIELASSYEPAANLLATHIKLIEMYSTQALADGNEDLNESDNFNKIELLKKLSATKQKEYRPTPKVFLELLQKPKLQRQDFYKKENFEITHKFGIEGFLVALSNGDGFEDLIDIYDSFYNSIKGNDDSIVTRYALLSSFLTGLDAARGEALAAQIDASPLLIWLYRDDDPTIVSLATRALLARSVSLDEAHGDEFVMEKMLISSLQQQVFWNKGAVFGAVLACADRRLTTMFYKLMDLLDTVELENAFYVMEDTKSAAVIDFLVDWIIHLGKSNKRTEAALTTQFLIDLTNRLKDQSVLEGVFRTKDVWSNSTEPDTFVEVPFSNYAARLLPKLDDFARQFRL